MDSAPSPGFLVSGVVLQRFVRPIAIAFSFVYPRSPMRAHKYTHTCIHTRVYPSISVHVMPCPLAATVQRTLVRPQLKLLHEQ